MAWSSARTALRPLQARRRWVHQDIQQQPWAALRAPPRAPACLGRLLAAVPVCLNRAAQCLCCHAARQPHASNDVRETHHGGTGQERVPRVRRIQKATQSAPTWPRPLATSWGRLWACCCAISSAVGIVADGSAAQAQGPNPETGAGPPPRRNTNTAKICRRARQETLRNALPTLGRPHMRPLPRTL